jgi:cytoskeletal protein CcmA (bactofilin family)
LEESRLGKPILIKGQISVSEPALIGGRIQGSISVPGARVAIGKEAQVAANITACDLNVSDRVHVHSEGSVLGDIIAQRIGVDDGALLKGNVELQASHGSTADAKGRQPVCRLAPAGT